MLEWVSFGLADHKRENKTVRQARTCESFAISKEMRKMRTTSAAKNANQVSGALVPANRNKFTPRNKVLCCFPHLVLEICKLAGVC